MGNIKKATRYFLFRERVSISKHVNGLLYFLRKLPWLGKKISPHAYASYHLKSVLFVIVAIFWVIFNLALKGVMIGASALMVGLFDYIFNQNGVGMSTQEYILGGLFVWFIMTVFINVYNIWFSQVESKTFEFMDNFQIPKKFFIRTTTLIDVLLQAIYYIPIAILVSWFLDEFIIALVMPILYLSLSYLSHFLSRLVLSKNKMSLGAMTNLLMVGGGLLILVAVVGIVLPVYTGTAWIQSIIFSPAIVIASLLILPVSIGGILTYKRENYYLAVLLDRSTAINEGAKNIHTHTTTNVQNKMTMTTSANEFANKKGNSYLNALLFDRYKKMFHKVILIRLIASAVIIIVFLAVNLFWMDLLGDASGLIPVLNIVLIPAWVSIFSVGRKIVQIVFVNCDNAMLHYPFYRRREVILSGFFDRLKRTFLLNSVLAIAPLAFALIIGFNSGMNFTFMGITIIILISILALFSFHELFLYYMLQPFATDMQVKNPLYTIITMISSMAIWFVIGGGEGVTKIFFVSETILAATLAGVTLLYVGLGTLLLHKFAPKTFKTKG